ncbi:MAG: sulfatase [Anaerolineae bacterium]|nr:sulfatase [Anaerolineae bacterium]
MSHTGSERPNILYIHTHDIGRYVQPYGFAMPTPNLQAFAEEGVLFRNAFCANPTCSASRSTLLTGMYPHNNGMTGLAHRGWSLNDYSQHIVHTLRDAGYITVLTGVQHVTSHEKGEPWKTIGYDRWLGDDNPHERAVAYLESAPEGPFFLSVGFGDTHREFGPVTDAGDPRYCRPPLPVPDTPETREDMARLMTSAREMDAKMGAVFDALKRTELDKSTLVICTTDHGIAFPGMKCNLTDHGTGIMLMLRGPGGFTGGRVIDALVGHIDLFPTLCDLLDIAPPDWLQGTSLMPLIRGEATEVNEAIFTEVNYHASYEPMRAIRTKRWKYIRRFENRGHPILPNCDDGLSKDVWLAHGWADMAPPDEMLFDLVFDPNEAHNLVGDPRAVDVLEDLRARLDAWMHATGDPLLKGPVPAPEGAVVNDPDGLSPRARPVPVG